jgi:hypothetical protein
MTEITREKREGRLSSTQQRDQHAAAAAPVKALSIREATARALDKHLEKVFCCACSAADVTVQCRCSPRKRELGWSFGKWRRARE